MATIRPKIMPGGPPLAASECQHHQCDCYLGGRAHAYGDRQGGPQGNPSIVDSEGNSSQSNQAILPLQLVLVATGIDDGAILDRCDGLIFCLACRLGGASL